jgi:hypothetical protein
MAATEWEVVVALDRLGVQVMHILVALAEQASHVLSEAPMSIMRAVEAEARMQPVAARAVLVVSEVAGTALRVTASTLTPIQAVAEAAGIAPQTI